MWQTRSFGTSSPGYLQHQSFINKNKIKALLLKGKDFTTTQQIRFNASKINYACTIMYVLYAQEPVAYWQNGSRRVSMCVWKEDFFLPISFAVQLTCICSFLPLHTRFPTSVFCPSLSTAFFWSQKAQWMFVLLSPSQMPLFPRLLSNNSVSLCLLVLYTPYSQQEPLLIG